MFKNQETAGAIGGLQNTYQSGYKFKVGTLVYLSTLSRGIITFYRTSDKKVLHILTVSTFLVEEGRCDLVGSLGETHIKHNIFYYLSSVPVYPSPWRLTAFPYIPMFTGGH